MAMALVKNLNNLAGKLQLCNYAGLMLVTIIRPPQLIAELLNL